jgi:hypothetical protein
MNRLRMLCGRALAAIVTLVVTLTFVMTPALAQDATPASSAIDALPQVLVKATDYQLDLPMQITAGRIAVTLENDGAEPHHAAFLRLNDGVTLDDVQAAVAKNPLAVFPLATAAGGPGTVVPGGRQRVVLDLTPGQYVVVCFISSPDGVSHATKGMVHPLAVVAGDAGSAPDPVADATVTLKDFAFDLPSPVSAGRHLWEVVNDGPEVHELVVLKLTAPLSPDQLLAVLAGLAAPSAGSAPAGPPPVAPAGGLSPIASGGKAWLELDLTPGNYVAVCFVPDPTTGKPHLALGMVMPFTVTA